jgi:small basic protein (TIGR04137 family)
MPSKWSFAMSLDRSLKGKSTLERHRNVLRRSERIESLEDNEKWSEGKSSVFGLVKVAHRKQVAAKKAPKAEVAEGATAAAVPAAGAKAGAAPAAPAAKAAAAPAAKGAAKK